MSEVQNVATVCEISSNLIKMRLVCDMLRYKQVSGHGLVGNLIFIR